MCIPIGPLNILVFNTKLKRGIRQAMSIAFGAAIMDFIYFFIILSGLSLFSINNKISFYFKIIGVLILFILGIKEIFFFNSNIKKNLKFNKKFGTKSFFFLGIIIYTSNPTLFFSLSTLCTFIKSFSFFPNSLFHNAVFSLFVSLGSLIWFYTLIIITSYFKI